MIEAEKTCPLSGRGLQLSAALFPAALANSTDAAIPAALAGRTAALCCGTTAPALSVLALVQGIIRDTALARLRVTALVMLRAVLGVGTAALAHGQSLRRSAAARRPGAAGDGAHAPWQPCQGRRLSQGRQDSCFGGQ